MNEHNTKKPYSSVKIVAYLTLGWIGLMGLMGGVAFGIVSANSDGDAINISSNLAVLTQVLL